MMNVSFVAGMTGALMLLSGTASAATISGFGLPSTAVSGGTTETFDTTTPGLYANKTFGNVTISGIDGDFTIGSDYNGQFNTSGGQSVFNDFDFVPSGFLFTFGAAVNAFAFNWGASDSGWTLAAYDAFDNVLESFILPPTFGSNDGEFFGISAVGISYARLTGDPAYNVENVGDYVFIDNFTSTEVDPVAPVPLPAGLPMFIAAIGALAWLRRSREI